MNAVESERIAKEIVAHREAERRAQPADARPAISLDEFFAEAQGGGHFDYSPLIGRSNPLAPPISSARLVPRVATRTRRNRPSSSDTASCPWSAALIRSSSAFKSGCETLGGAGLAEGALQPTANPVKTRVNATRVSAVLRIMRLMQGENCT